MPIGALRDLEVVRARIDIGDFGRINNQNQVLKALVLKMLTPDGLRQIPDLVNRLKAYVLTDLSPADITQMVCLAGQIDTKEDIVYHNIITNEEEVQAEQWIMDEFQGGNVYALVMERDLISQRIADFQAGIWP